MGKIAAVWSADGPGPDAQSAEDSWSLALESMQSLLAAGLLFDVLNGKLATWGLDCSKAV